VWDRDLGGHERTLLHQSNLGRSCARATGMAANRFPYSFDRVATDYDTAWALPDDILDPVISCIAKLCRGGRLLEVGVGTGRLAIPLQREGVAVIGTDVSRRMLTLGRRKGAESLFLADAHRLPLADKVVRTAMTNRVLHLLSSWPAALAEICRVTSGRYLSVLERASADPDVDAEYIRLVQDAGSNTRRPGIYERELVNQLRPVETFDIRVVDAVVPASYLISMLEKRVYSSQWNIPEEVHRAAIRSVCDKFDGQQVSTRNDGQIVTWTIDSMHEFLEN